MQPTRLDLPGIRSDLREQKTSSSIFVWTTLSGKKRKQALFTEIDDEQNLWTNQKPRRQSNLIYYPLGNIVLLVDLITQYYRSMVWYLSMVQYLVTGTLPLLLVGKNSTPE